MAKLTDYAAATRFDSGDILIKDGTNGTKKITASNAAVEFAGLVSAVNHRNVFRGKNLGTSVTAAQKAAIADGSFDDLFIGDYWTINGTRYDIADMDYWYNTGSPHVCHTHHLVMIPHESMRTDKMNASNTTEGGYLGSDLYHATNNITGLSVVRNLIRSAFPSMLLTHYEYFVNAVNEDGYPTAATWVESTIDLMNEIMIYGSYICAAGVGDSSRMLGTVDKRQLALFQLARSRDVSLSGIWLRDISSDKQFCTYTVGSALSRPATTDNVGIAPVFGITGE